MVVWVGGLGRLVGWLIGRTSERARAAPCESSLYLDDKEPGERASRTSLNGTDEWLWKQHLICIEGASLSTG